MGTFLERITRYHTIALLLTGLPLAIFALPILRLWVGPAYASHTATYLRVLIFANVVRNLCAPYATMITATGTQKAVIAAAVSEAVVNLGSSVFLAWRFGAIGVAIGTVIGAFVSVLVHFVISMRLTRPVISASRTRLFLRGILWPCIIGLPSALLIVHVWPANNFGLLSCSSILWAVCTLVLAYFCLNRGERHELNVLVLRSRHRYARAPFSICL
jgi:O-antigen/teichoic acid export membrane protein